MSKKNKSIEKLEEREKNNIKDINDFLHDLSIESVLQDLNIENTSFMSNLEDRINQVNKLLNELSPDNKEIYTNKVLNVLTLIDKELLSKKEP